MQSLRDLKRASLRVGNERGGGIAEGEDHVSVKCVS